MYDLTSLSTEEKALGSRLRGGWWNIRASVEVLENKKNRPCGLSNCE